MLHESYSSFNFNKKIEGQRDKVKICTGFTSLPQIAQEYLAHLGAVADGEEKIGQGFQLLETLEHKIGRAHV